MARQLRIDHPGAFFHVYSRGNRKQEVFLSDEDRSYFLKILGDACGEFGVRIHAFCLMPNHYHLFAEVLFGGLSKTLHWINTSYTVYFNKKHDRCGHLFQGRFKSILVQAETYAWELVRYIHLNPVRAGLARRPEDYHWSSHPDYLGMRPRRPWLAVSSIFGHSGLPSAEEVRHFEDYVLSGINAEDLTCLGQAKRTGVLGDPSFIDKVRTDFLADRPVSTDRERPQLRFFRVRPEIRDIVRAVEEALGPKNRFLKGLAILVSKRAAGYKAEEIGAFFGMSVSGVHSARQKTQKEMAHNDALGRAYEIILGQLDSLPKNDPSDDLVGNCRKVGLTPS